MFFVVLRIEKDLANRGRCQYRPLFLLPLWVVGAA